MRLETFFEKFDQFADAPEAVARLRALVLELAVRGRLSERIASDCTDLEWLNLLRILDAKYSKNELDHRSLFDIPNSWRWVTLDDLGDTKPRNEALDSATCSFVPMAFISAEYGRTVQSEKRVWGEVKKGYTHFSNGDVVMAKITPCFENGKSAIVENLEGRIGAGTTELHVFRRSSSLIDPWFVLLYLKSSGFIERGVPRMTGSAGQKRVPSDYFANSPFPLPPPEEQKRIVAKAKELLAVCDRLEEQQKRRETQQAALIRAAIARFDEATSPANLNFLFHPSYSVTPAELRKIILNLAVQGKLVVQDLTDEPAQQLLKSISAKYESGARRRALSELSPEPLLDLPPGWCWARFPELGEFSRGKSKHRPRNDRSLFVGGKYPLVQTGDVARSNGTIRTFTGLYNDVGLAQSKMWPAGTLCITIAANIADSGVLAIDACFPDSVVGFVPDHLVPSIRFFEYFMRTAKDRLEQYAPSTAQKNINLAILEQVWIPFPPANEQRRIVAKVDQLMSLVDQMESQLATSEKTAKELLDAVVHELLHPTADVIEFPSIESDSSSRRAAIGCYAIEHLKSNPSFGHTMNMKVVYMAQAHIGLPLDLKFKRQAAGPWHPWIEEFDAVGQSEGWFTVTQKSIGDGHTKYEYVPKAALRKKVAEAAAILGEHRAEVDRLLGFFADMKTVDAEIVATLFAAWNDFLIDGKTPTDDEIVREVRENWHQSKERFTPALLQRWLHWMRSHHLIPKGRGLRTRQQLTLALK